MTVQSPIAKSGPYNGNGVQTAFDYNFKIFDAGWLAVYLTPVTGDDQLVPPANYSVTNVGEDAGQVIMTLAPATGEKLTIVRSQDLLQQAGFTNQGGYRGETHERVYDRLIMQIQQVNEGLDRALRAPPSIPSDVDLVLPPPSYPGILGWSPDLKSIENYIPNDGAYLSVPVSFLDGGTGASYADLATLLTAWGLVVGFDIQPYSVNTALINAIQTWPARQVFTPQSIVSVAGVLSPDFADGNFVQCTMAEDITSVLITNTAVGGVFKIMLVQAAGLYSITGWPVGVQWVGGLEPEPSTTSGGYTIITLEYGAGGVILGSWGSS